jgi:hypothetical protein
VITRKHAEAILPVLLVLVGLGLISYGLGLIYPPLGYIAAGLSCLAAEMWRTDKGRTDR